MPATSKAKAIAAAFKVLPGNKLHSVADLTTQICTTWRDFSAEEEEEEKHSAQVLGNDDLLHLIFEHCACEDIQNLRLCSHLFESVASHYLFRRLTLGFRKRYVRRFIRVAAIEKFSTGVREIVWERVSYSSNVPWLEVLTALLDGDQMEPRVLHRIVAKYKRFALDEEQMDGMDKPPAILPMLIAAMRRLRKLERVELTQWAQKGQNFWDLPSLLGSGQRDAIPIHTVLEDAHTAATRNSCALVHLLAALTRSESQIKKLVVRPTRTADVGHIPEMLSLLPLPGMMLLFDHSEQLTGELRHAVRGLRKLQLDLSLEDNTTTDVAFLPVAFKGEGIRALFKELAQLEDISVRIHSSKTVSMAPPTVVCTSIVPLSAVFDLESPYPALRKLHLGSFWLEPAELCKMIGAHSSNLEHVTLSDINLGGTEGALQAIPHLAVLAEPRSRRHAAAQKRVHEEWVAVAETCRTVPKLSGLLIESPSVSADWTHLPLSDTEDLMEMGMDGKHNALYSDRHWGEDLGW